MNENDLVEYNEYMKELNEVVKKDDLLAYTSFNRLLDTHATLRVIEELEKQLENYFNQEVETYLSDNLKNRINELKQN
jgi:hypothetical protein